jgi:GNAT superfamily N-acetyltransferase
MTELSWLEKLTNLGHGFALLLNNKIVGVLFADNVIDNGVMIWLIVIKPEQHNKKLGSVFLKYFEDHMKEIGKTWIFLNSTEESINFYKRNNYLFKPYHIYEFYKEL